MRDRNSDIYLNEYDPAPSWRESSNARPHRITASGIWELPFGKGRAFAHQGPQNMLLGGWQIGVTYEFQPGALIDFGNLFYNGSLSDINTGKRTFAHWFNTAGFVTDPAKQPAAYQSRVFPTRVDGLRADFTNIANGCLQREFKIRERGKLEFRVDALNLQNRSQMAAPVVDPTATNFPGIARTQDYSLLGDYSVAFGRCCVLWQLHGPVHCCADSPFFSACTGNKVVLRDVVSFTN